MSLAEAGKVAKKIVERNLISLTLNDSFLGQQKPDSKERTSTMGFKSNKL
jgi:hypothetical protein